MSVSVQAAPAAISRFEEASPKRLHNLSPASLYEHAVRRGEGAIAAEGPLVVKTGEHTGRSAQDKFTVRHAEIENDIWWDNNKPMAPDAFERLYDDMLAFASTRELYRQDLFGGADPEYRIRVRALTEYAWHSLFIQHLLIRPTAEERLDSEPDFTIVDLPSFEADPSRHGCRSKTRIEAPPLAVDIVPTIFQFNATPKVAIRLSNHAAIAVVAP